MARAVAGGRLAALVVPDPARELQVLAVTKPVLSASLIATIQRWTNRPGGDEDSERSSAFALLL